MPNGTAEPLVIDFSVGDQSWQTGEPFHVALDMSECFGTG